MAINATKYTRTVSCRYCGKEGHSVQHCPIIPIDGAKAQQKKGVGQVLNYTENYALQRWQKNKTIAEKRSLRTTTRKPRKCGFCGHEGHTRRHCGEVTATKALFHEANVVWRAFWAKLAIEHGFAPASLIKITMDGWYAQRYDTKTATVSLVGNEMPENLTIFAIADDYDMRQEINIPLASSNQGGLESLKPKAFVREEDQDRQYLYAGYGWSNISSLEVLSKSTYVYSDEWIKAYPKDIDYTVKRWNKAKLSRFISTVKSFMEYAERVHNLTLATIE